MSLPLGLTHALALPRILVDPSNWGISPPGPQSGAQIAHLDTILKTESATESDLILYPRCFSDRIRRKPAGAGALNCGQLRKFPSWPRSSRWKPSLHVGHDDLTLATLTPPIGHWM